VSRCATRDVLEQQTVIGAVGPSALFGTAGWGVFGFFQASDLPSTQGEVSTSPRLFSGAERQTTHPHLPPSDTDHCPVFKGFAMLGENALQRAIHAIGMHIAEAKRDHTGQRGPTRGNQLPEAEVVHQHNTSFLAGLLDNAWVW